MWVRDWSGGVDAAPSEELCFLSLLSIPVIPTPLLKDKPFNCEQGTGVISSLETNCSWKQARGEKNEGKK